MESLGLTTPITLSAHAALLGHGYETSGPVTITIAQDRIADIRPAPPPPGPRLLAMPALADAHNHARPISTTSFGCGGLPLEAWLPKLAVMPAVDPYLAAAAAFSRSLKGGVTSVMVHLTRAMGPMPLPDEAREIARAAHDVGVSIGFAIAMRDRNPLIYGDHTACLEGLDDATRKLAQEAWFRPFAAIDAQMALVNEVARAVADAPGHIDVQYGPTGVQWCTDALLSRIAEASARTGRRVHIHLLETQPQRAWADETYPGGIVAALADLGLLSPRLTLAHCVWARDDELALIAQAGARIAVNVSSNLHLFSGIAPVPAMLSAGVDVAMGLDGCALDEDDDALRELRLFHLLNHACGFADGGLTRPTALRSACATGRAGLGLEPGGILVPGAPADILLLDLDALDRDVLMPVDPQDYLFTRATRGHITQAYSRGRLVLENGTPCGLNDVQITQDLRDAYRDTLPQTAPLAAAWPAIEAQIAAHYKGCC